MASALLEADSKPEGAAFAWTTIATGIAAHDLRNLLCDCQPDSQTSVLAGGRIIDLFEDGEQSGLVFGSNADAGIFNLETNQDMFSGFSGKLQPNGYGPCLGEADRVGDIANPSLSPI